MNGRWMGRPAFTQGTTSYRHDRRTGGGVNGARAGVSWCPNRNPNQPASPSIRLSSSSLLSLSVLRQVAHLQTIKTATGRELIVSGWWGLARKINYTGDWLMGLAWCLLCGPTHIVP